MFVLVLLAAASVIVGEQPFNEARAVADQHRRDPAMVSYNSWDIAAAVGMHLVPTVNRCREEHDTEPREPDLGVVLQFDRSGVVDKVFVARDTPLARCVAKGLSAIKIPPPPLPNLSLYLWESTQQGRPS